MQESWSEETTAIPNDKFISMLERAKSGDNDALTKVLQELDPDIQYLSRFLKMQKEDGVQAIKTKFIEFLRDRDEEITELKKSM